MKNVKKLEVSITEDDFHKLSRASKNNEESFSDSKFTHVSFVKKVWRKLILLQILERTKNKYCIREITDMVHFCKCCKKNTKKQQNLKKPGKIEFFN